MKKETKQKITKVSVRNHIKWEGYIFSISLKTSDNQYIKYTFSCEDDIDSVAAIPDIIIEQLLELAIEVSNTSLASLVKTCPMELPDSYTLNTLVESPTCINKVRELAVSEYIYAGEILLQMGLIIPADECDSNGNPLSEEDALQEAVKDAVFNVVLPISKSNGEVPLTETYYLSTNTGHFICYENDSEYVVPTTLEECVAMVEHVTPKAGILNPIQIATLYLQSIKSQIFYTSIYEKPLLDVCPSHKLIVDEMVKNGNDGNVPRGTLEGNE